MNKNTEKELLLKLLDFIIGVVEINEIGRQKSQAVKAQDFELACKLRGLETEKADHLPSIEEIKELRAKLEQQ